MFFNVPSIKAKDVDSMLKMIHDQEDRQAPLEKAQAVAEKLRAMNLVSVAKTVEDGILETLSYTEFPHKHWRKLLANNPIE